MSASNSTGPKWRWFQKIGESFAAAMFEPMPVADGQNRHHRNREKDSRNPGQLRARKDRDDYGEWMQMNSLANQTRIDNVVLNDAQHS